MTSRELKRRAAQRAQSLSTPLDQQRVLTFQQWIELNGISKSTGLRIIAAGKIKIMRLGARRIGIRVADNDAFQQSCVIEGGA